MIKKLRMKFILINMTFIVSILAVVLSVFYYTTAGRLEHQTFSNTMQVLREGVHNKKKISPDDVPIPPDSKEMEPGKLFRVIPAVVLTLDADGTTILDMEDNNLSITEEQAEDIVRIVNTSTQDNGTIKEHSLYYAREVLQNGVKIACTDRSLQINVLNSILLNCLLTFFVCIVLFFFLSLYLSKWALRPVEQAWLQQNQFIADASHELKTPLTVILANLQILSGHRESSIESQEKWLKNTRTETERMKYLVEELLFLARSDAQPHHAPFTVFDYSDVVTTGVLLFESVAFEKKVTLESDIAPTVLIDGNENQIKQVVTILLDNACKYAGKGGVVHLKMQKQQNQSILTVHNTGEPIPAEDIEHVFERFYRTDKSRARKEGGYGLGLSIAQTIIRQHKGKITVMSEPESGTVFTVTLPCPR